MLAGNITLERYTVFCVVLAIAIVKSNNGQTALHNHENKQPREQPNEA
jgi:hypothetical protein